MSKISQIHPIDQLFGIKGSLLLALRINVVPCRRLRQQGQCSARYCRSCCCTPTTTCTSNFTASQHNSKTTSHAQAKIQGMLYLSLHAWHKSVQSRSCTVTSQISSRCLDKISKDCLLHAFVPLRVLSASATLIIFSLSVRFLQVDHRLVSSFVAKTSHQGRNRIMLYLSSSSRI